jgi:prefoldin subunit 5
VHVKPSALANLERIMHEEIDPLRQQLASLAETVQKVNAQLDIISGILRRGGAQLGQPP